MRLSRESRKVKKDFDAQIKKNGKITDNYVCAPDPEDPLTWYYVVFGLDGDYKGGYYFGKVVCPQDYPARPPYITVLTPNGNFEAGEKVCLSITDYHPESWNPAWTVTHVIIGMISFWLSGEETAGSTYYESEEEKTKMCLKYAFESRRSVLEMDNYKECLAYYSEFIGINEEVMVEGWEPFKKELEAKLKAEAEAKAKAEAEAEEKAKLQAELFEEEEAKNLETQQNDKEEAKTEAVEENQETKT